MEMKRASGIMVVLLASLALAAGGCGGDASTGGGDDASTGGGDAGTDTDIGTDTGTDSGTDTVTDILCADDGPCIGLGLICNESWGICVAPDCAGEDDFTPCETVTAPDRSYDICVDGVCVSPGCGDGTCNAPGPHFPLADTGQHGCYDNNDWMACTSFPCNANGSPAFCGQDAQYGWDATHEASERFTRDLSVSGEPVVTDNVTGLVWQGCTYGSSGNDCFDESAIEAGWAEQLVNCDGLDWFGGDDWRLPDRDELQSLADYGKYPISGPMIDTDAFPGTPRDRFWSSSSRAASASNAWNVDFSYGLVGDNDKLGDAHARCVRGGPTPGPVRFTRDTSTSGQPTVIDNRTELEWQGCARGLTGDACGTGSAAELPWQWALDHCEELDWGGDTDWRLPSVGELQSIADNRKTTAPVVDETAFPGTPSSWFWSSSSVAVHDTSFAWNVNFASGNVSSRGKAFLYHARCVRGGPISAL